MVSVRLAAAAGVDADDWCHPNTELVMELRRLTLRLTQVMFLIAPVLRLDEIHACPTADEVIEFPSPAARCHDITT
jgi:hypothetical protein